MMTLDMLDGNFIGEVSKEIRPVGPRPPDFNKRKDWIGAAFFVASLVALGQAAYLLMFWGVPGWVLALPMFFLPIFVGWWVLTEFDLMIDEEKRKLAHDIADRVEKFERNATGYSRRLEERNAQRDKALFRFLYKLRSREGWTDFDELEYAPLISESEERRNDPTLSGFYQGEMTSRL